jgi:hypothetical protein
MFATSAELDDGALAELRVHGGVRAAAGGRASDRVGSAGSIERGRLRGTRDDACAGVPAADPVEIAGRAGAIRLRLLAPERDAAGVFLHLSGFAGLDFFASRKFDLLCAGRLPTRAIAAGIRPRATARSFGRG